MSLYPQRVADNILPLSVAGTLPEAFKEWHFNNNMEDHEIPEANCELCNQEDLRYHFQIENNQTNHRLWVGSSCILKFQVQVLGEDGDVLNAKDSERKLNKLRGKMRLDSCIMALTKLTKSEPNDILQNTLTYYQKNKKLTPKQAFVIFWRLKKHNIDHNPSFFKINLSKKKCKQDIVDMQHDRLPYIYPALTASQKKLVSSLRE